MLIADDLPLLRQALALHDEAHGVPHIVLEPHQEAPPFTSFWLLEAGRGSGKSVAAVDYVRRHLDGPPCISHAVPHRVSLIAPTIGDAAESAELNDISLLRVEPGARISQQRGGTIIYWPNGSQVRLFGAHTRDDVNRLRAGGNRCLAWVEELASWRYLREAWNNMMFGLRLGPTPKIVGTTTPKPRPEYKTIRSQADTITNASIRDNPHLAESRRQLLIDMYEGTALGEQELEGKLIEEAEGALWTYELINAWRMSDRPPLGRIVVAVDPPGGVTEAGIVAAGTAPNCRCGSDGRQPHFAVLADRSAKLSPHGWGSRAVDLCEEEAADRILGEPNFGGDMVEATIRNIDPAVSYKEVRASRGKRQRAEPVKALYEQGRVHHVGVLAELEAEQVQWIPDESSWSPNRVDALVWALTDLSGVRRKVGLAPEVEQLTRPSPLV